MKNKSILAFLFLSLSFTACKDGKLAPVAANAVKPTAVTEALPHDTDAVSYTHLTLPTICSV